MYFRKYSCTVGAATAVAVATSHNYTYVPWHIIKNTPVLNYIRMPMNIVNVGGEPTMMQYFKDTHLISCNAMFTVMFVMPVIAVYKENDPVFDSYEPGWV